MHRCPFPHCLEYVKTDIFACRKHWSGMSKEERDHICDLWNKYQRKEITAEELKGNQQDVIDKYAKSAQTETRLKQLSILVKELVAKRKEYTACKDGHVDRKKKLGTELARLEKAAVDFADTVLKPKAVQPRLFDPENRTQLPD